MVASTARATSLAMEGSRIRSCATSIPNSFSSRFSTVSTISFIEYARSSAIQYVSPAAWGAAAASRRPSEVLSTYDMLRRDSPSPTIGALPCRIIWKNWLWRGGCSGP